MQNRGTKDYTTVCGYSYSLKILRFQFAFFFQISQTNYLDGMSRGDKGSHESSVELSVHSIELAGHLDG
jgi:hypothetical protein